MHLARPGGESANCTEGWQELRAKVHIGAREGEGSERSFCVSSGLDFLVFSFRLDYEVRKLVKLARGKGTRAYRSCCASVLSVSSLKMVWASVFLDEFHVIQPPNSFSSITVPSSNVTIWRLA